jgi:hypothetical protein
MYASGEDLKPSRSNIPAESFYKVLTKSFGFDRFAKLHTGDLSRYLTWIFTGLVAVIILLMLVWT